MSKGGVTACTGAVERKDSEEISTLMGKAAAFLANVPAQKASVAKFRKKFAKYSKNKTGRSRMDEVYQEFVEDVRQRTELAADEILAKRNQPELAAERDRLIEASSGGHTWRPNGTPEDNVEAHTRSAYSQRKERLQQLLAKTRSRREELSSKLEATRVKRKQEAREVQAMIVESSDKIYPVQEVTHVRFNVE